jgi:hypothetical protein
MELHHQTPQPRLNVAIIVEGLLNPIERLWAVMHQHVTHNRAYPTQKLFTEAILKFFRKVIPEQWHNFRNQVTDNFRIISEQNLRVLE